MEPIIWYFLGDEEPKISEPSIKPDTTVLKTVALK